MIRHVSEGTEQVRVLLEPAVVKVPWIALSLASEMSTAISLRRLADAMEMLAHHPNEVAMPGGDA